MMPDLFRSLVPDAAQTPLAVLLRLLAAWLLGALVALVYRRTRPAADVLPSFPGTLVLLSVLIAMVTQVIGDNVARAFSLVGALSIVRFRTVVRDTQDTAYVICAVAVGMAVGATRPWVAVAGLGVIAAAAYAMREREISRSPTSAAYDLDVRIPLGADIERMLRPVVETHMHECNLVSVATGRQGLVLDVTFTGVLRDDRSAERLVRALNGVEGIQDVRLKRSALRAE
jgi:hypothetical protein